MKHIKIIRKSLLFALCSLLFALNSCSDWLDVRPKDLQYTADFWKSKEDVQAVLASGYSNMRVLSNNLLLWGELRGASISSTVATEARMQNFQLNPVEALCSWSTIYAVLNMANSVIKYAPEVRNVDATYTEGAMESHRAEAYFMRGLMYFYLVRNWREAPLVLEPYINDDAPLSIAKSSEEDIIAQIKKDITAALESGAAKERFEGDAWASKGRATKWALYALMADVCLWSEDYDKCIEYADLLIDANAAWRPVFMTNPEQWFEMFDPGNSNESIFEINWRKDQTSGSPYSFFQMSSVVRFFTPAMTQRLRDETIEAILAGGGMSVRSQYGALGGWFDDGRGSIYKYQGSSTKGITRDVASANHIIYRMADVMLMKAEALIWKGGEDNREQALALINKIRVRANLLELTVDVTQTNELALLEIVLNERDMEFAAEGKRWYDILRFGRSKNFKYQQEFIAIILENNQTANQNWLRSALRNNWAWYLPVSQDDLEVNELLVQNPYYY